MGTTGGLYKKNKSSAHDQLQIQAITNTEGDTICSITAQEIQLSELIQIYFSIFSDFLRSANGLAL